MDGFLVINKQKGWTSADVVNKIKRVLKIKKAGHLGTLDPDATGVLLVAVGKATKVIRYINEGDKEYQAVMKLGEKTDTLDASGKVIETKEIPKLDRDKIEKVLKDFTGKISQTPPAYSAVKVDGVRAYELARKGKAVQIRPRDVVIKNISLTNINIPFIAFNVVCSKGTYIRSLCSDIGERLGTAAHMFSLIRTASGEFKIGDAVQIDDLEKTGIEWHQDRLIKIDEALGFMPEVRIKKDFEDKVKNGMPITASFIEKISHDFKLNDKVRIYSDEKLTAVGIAKYNSSQIADLSDKEALIKIDKILV